MNKDKVIVIRIDEYDKRIIETYVQENKYKYPYRKSLTVSKFMIDTALEKIRKEKEIKKDEKII